MELTLSRLSYEIALVYLDDNVILGRTFKENLERLELSLCRLKEAVLKIKGQKNRFFQKKIHFLGNIGSKNGVEFDTEKINAVKDMKDPHKNEQLRAELGLIGFYRRFKERFGTALQTS